MKSVLYTNIWKHWTSLEAVDGGSHCTPELAQFSAGGHRDHLRVEMRVGGQVFKPPVHRSDCIAYPEFQDIIVEGGHSFSTHIFPDPVFAPIRKQEHNRG